MESLAENRILIPSDAPRRQEIEEALRNEGWMPLPYRDIGEAETKINDAAAKAILLSGPGDDTLSLEFVKKVRTTCPQTFVVGVGEKRHEDGPDTMLHESCTPADVTTAIRLGAALHAARVSERALRSELNSAQKVVRAQGLRIQELEASCQSLKKWAHTAQALALRDELTQLYNRRFFFQTAAQQLERSRREQSRFAVAMIDIDFFKAYNDTYGHVAGDHALRWLAQILLGNFRRMDTVARYGGEEFIALLPETHNAPASTSFDPVAFLERVREAVAQTPLPHPNQPNETAQITISAGVVQYPDGGENIDDLVHKADQRLYHAKESGRNRVVGTDPADQDDETQDANTAT